MKKKVLLFAIALFLVTGCGNVELKNGENAIVTFKNDEGISSTELYEALKEKYGTDVMVNLIDTVLLDKEYDTTSEQKKYVSEAISSIKSEAKKQEVQFLDFVNSNYGFDNQKDLENYLSLNYKRNLWITDWAKEQVTDTQVKDYYEKVAIGDIEASHILISTEATDDMTDDEKDNLENDALKKANEVIEKLNNGSDFAELAKEYSDDKANASKGGYLGFFNRGEMVSAFENAAVNLEVGKYSTTPVKTEFGYHIIYKTSQKDKPKLDEVKDEIKEKISTETLSTDSSLSLLAIKALREKYEMTIKDSILKNGYDEIMGN